MTDNWDVQSMQSKREVLENERRLKQEAASARSTFLDHAATSAMDAYGGRYSSIAMNNPPNVVGRTPVPQYPKLPPESPWHHDPTSPEEPLGWSVNDTPVVGEPHEQSPTLLGGSGPTATGPEANAVHETAALEGATARSAPATPEPFPHSGSGVREDGVPGPISLDQALGKAPTLARRDVGAPTPDREREPGSVFDISKFVRRV
jgi:hypothetical protein